MMAQVISLLLALFIGLSLGLIGGGGSTLTVPVLVYVAGIRPMYATSYSLFIVGVTALFGVLGYFRNKQVKVQVGLWFAVPAFVAVLSMRKWVIPIIPEVLISTPYFILTKDMALMLFFATLLLFAARAMLRGVKNTITQSEILLPEDLHAAENAPPPSMTSIALIGILTGGITGTVGVGGGFMIVPSLVLLAKLEMKDAVGTSLFIIAINSLVGFTGDIVNGVQPDWQILFSFTSIAIIGLGVGIYLSPKFSAEALKKVFGYFLLLIAVAILTKEFVFT